MLLWRNIRCYSLSFSIFAQCSDFEAKSKHHHQIHRHVISSIHFNVPHIYYIIHRTHVTHGQSLFSLSLYISVCVSKLNGSKAVVNSDNSCWFIIPFECNFFLLSLYFSIFFLSLLFIFELEKENKIKTNHKLKRYNIQ